jgi:tetratricopeptide (TPR) repeat protein
LRCVHPAYLSFPPLLRCVLTSLVLWSAVPKRRMAYSRFLPDICFNANAALLDTIRFIPTHPSRCTLRIFLAVLPFFFWAFLPPLRTFAADSPPPPWTEIHAKHFVVTTDAGEKQGREVAFRLEQMRAVFGSLLMKNRLNQPVPVAIIALKDDGEYSRTAPASAEGAGGFLLQGEDREFIVLNLSNNEPWRAIAHDFASLFLKYNYPPTQDWFDEGIATYFSSIRVGDKQIEIGGDPGSPTVSTNSSKTLAEVLHASTWMPLPELFAARLPASKNQTMKNAALFEAQSWMVVHYLLDKNLLQQTGNYFELVQNEKVPFEPALSKAFNMSTSQFEEAVKTYYRSHSWLPAPQNQVEAQAQSPVTRLPSPIGPDDFGMTASRLPDVDARALLADARARVPGRREQGMKDLKDLAGDPANNQLAHRALAWAYIDQKKFNAAVEELGTAAELNQRDPWVRYYLSLLKYRMAQTNHEAIQGLANMMQDLRAVLDWYPEFAEAYNMLAMARVEGGGPASAMEAIRAAIQLSPRNEQYVYNLGLVYALGKKWEAARAVFERLKLSENPELAAAAKEQLAQMQTVQKYGIASAPPTPPREKQTPSQIATAPPSKETTVPGSSDAENQAAKPEAPPPLSGPILFAKGKLISVDCSKSPVAYLKIVAGGKTMELKTADYKSLSVIGADSFSCTWGNQSISVNYRATGKASGELVSVEVQ